MLPDHDGSGWDQKMADFLETQKRIQTEMQEAIIAQKEFAIAIKKANIVLDEEILKQLKLPTSVDSLPTAEHISGSW